MLEDVLNASYGGLHYPFFMWHSCFMQTLKEERRLTVQEKESYIPIPLVTFSHSLPPSRERDALDTDFVLEGHLVKLVE